MTPRRLLAVVLVLAAAVRLWGIGFGLPAAYARPDETEVAGPAVGFLSGDLRPPFFQWPTLFSYVVALAYFVYGGVAGSFTGYETLLEFADSRRNSIAPFLYLSRGLSLTMGVATVWAVFALGRRAFDDTVGIVAALFLALAFLHVRDSHFGVTDVAMTALVVCAVLAAVRWRASGGLGRAACAGLVTGLAASTKYNGVGAAVSFGVAAALRALDGRPSRATVGSQIAPLLVFGLTLVSAFLGASPYILIDWSRFLQDVGSVQSTLAVGHGLNVGQGWWYFARVVLPAGVGWPILLSAVAGAVALLATAFRQSAVLLVFPLAYYAVAGRGYAVFARHILPVVPFVCILAAWMVVRLVHAATPRASAKTRGVITAIVAMAMVAPTAYRTWQLDRLLATDDNRVVVSRALAKVIAPGSVVCQTGAGYGRVPLALEGRDLQLRECEYDLSAGRFTADPMWVIVQRSPLTLYSPVPESLEARLGDEFTLVARFPTETNRDVVRVYDQQDAFYLPLQGLEGIRRPGPSFDLYRRREVMPLETPGAAPTLRETRDTPGVRHVKGCHGVTAKTSS